jgi:AcrR family transcriptional regulator
MSAAVAVQKRTARDALLRAGRDIVLRAGFADLTVREVATAAGANLGSFVYHFGTRDAFLRTLIEDWYGPVFSRVQLVAESGGSAIDRLRRAILQLLEPGVDDTGFLGRLLMGAAAGETAARDFLSTIAGRHPRVLIELVRDAQAAGALVDEEPMQVMLFIMGSVALPRLIATAWEGPPLFGKTLSSALGRIARDRDLIVQRLDWAIRGLTPEGR